METICPRSHVALFCLGILVPACVHYLGFAHTGPLGGLEPKAMLALTLAMACVFYPLSRGIMIGSNPRISILGNPARYRKFFWVTLGIASATVLLAFRSHEAAQASAKIATWRETHQSNDPHKFFSLQPEGKIRKNLYLVSITPLHSPQYPSEDTPTKEVLLLPYAVTNEQFEQRNMGEAMVCPISAFHFQNVEESSFLYPHVRPHGAVILRTKDSLCETPDGIPPVVIYGDRAKNIVKQLLYDGKIRGIPAGVAMGLIFGESGYLDRDLYDSAKESGTLHLFAASGLHIGILIASLYLLTRKVFRLGFYLALTLPLGFAWLYLFLLDFPVSLTRAYFFALCMVATKCLFRSIRPMDLLIVSGALVFVMRPSSFLSVGMYLSFTAVAGIFFLKPILDKLTFGEKTNALQDNATISLSATLGTFPVVWATFPGFSFGSIFANFFLVPWTGIVLPLLYFSLAISFLVPPEWASWVWIWTDLFLRILIVGTEFFATIAGFYREWSFGKTTVLGLWCVLLLILVFAMLFRSHLSEKMRRKARPFLAMVSFFSIVLFFIGGYLINNTQKLSIGLNPVSQIMFVSDHAFLFFNEKKAYLGGYCKKDLETITKTINRDFCRNLDSLYLDHDTCIPVARICATANKNIKLLFGSKYLNQWQEAFEGHLIENGKRMNSFDWNGKPIVFYKSGYDPDWVIRYWTRRSQDGILVVQSPPVHKKNPKRKNNPEKSLGQSTKWKILNLNEARKLSLLQAHRDSQDSE